MKPFHYLTQIRNDVRAFQDVDQQTLHLDQNAKRNASNNDATINLLMISFDGDTPLHRGLAWYQLWNEGLLDNPPERLIQFLLERFHLDSSKICSNICVSFLKGVSALFVEHETDDHVSKWFENFMQQLGGNYLVIMSADPKIAADYLNNDNRDLRSAAFQLYINKHPISPEIAAIAEYSLKADSDAGVRISALGVLEKFITQFGDRKLLKTIAEIVVDDSNEEVLRELAYQSLLIICGRPVEMWPEVLRALGEFRMSRDVDWEFVRSLS